MLRGILIALGAASLVGGIIALWAGAYPSVLVFAVWGVLLVVGTLYERFRYKPIEARPLGPGWAATGERFIDDETGKPVTVYVEARTGERKYVNE